MGRVRWIAVALATLALAACAGDVTATRADVTRAAIVTTTTDVAVPPTTEPPGPANADAEENAEDPVLPGPPQAARARAGRSNGATPQPTGHLEIPAIGLSHATFEGIDLPTIDHGPSHWPGTPLPGERGNTVFPGHRTTHSRPFWDIDQLRSGDEVIFTTLAGRFTYRVTETFVVHWTEEWILEGTDAATFTIFACHPKGSARQRYVAKGELVSPPATTTTTTTRSTTTTAPPPQEPSRGILPGLPG